MGRCLGSKRPLISCMRDPCEEQRRIDESTTANWAGLTPEQVKERTRERRGER